MKTQLLLVTILAGLLTACEAPPAIEHDRYSGPDYPKTVAIEGLDDVVRGGDAVVSQPGNRPMTVSVPLRSVSSNYKNVQYRFQFFDSTGMPLAPEMEWAFLRMPPKAQVFVKGSAQDTIATTWRLIVRPAY